MAASIHDHGFLRSDADSGPDGEEVHFSRLPTDDHLHLWRLSIARAMQYSRFSALLISRHFSSLFYTRLPLMNIRSLHRPHPQ